MTSQPQNKDNEELLKAMDSYMADVYNVRHFNKQKKKLLENGYEMYIARQGCLVDDELWVHPETIQAHITNTHNPKYIFVFKEKYLNEWSSTQTMRRYKKLCKSHIKVLNEFHDFTLDK